LLTSDRDREPERRVVFDDRIVAAGRRVREAGGVASYRAHGGAREEREGAGARRPREEEGFERTA